MCSLEEAFDTFNTEPRNVQPWGSDLHEKKRKKKKRAALPEPEALDPDRQMMRPLPPAELLGGPPTENRESSSHSELLTASEMDTSKLFAHPNDDIQDPNIYNLEPDWAKVPEWMKDRMPQRDAESPLVPSPWMDGASTLWQQAPSQQGMMRLQSSVPEVAGARLSEMQQRLDAMFQKLEDLEVTRSESNHLEIILFVLGGIFVLLVLDMLVRQGTRAMMLVAAAGGGVGGGRGWLFT